MLIAILVFQVLTFVAALVCVRLLLRRQSVTLTPQATSPSGQPYTGTEGARNLYSHHLSFDVPS